jgi:hypothetical protein
VVGPDQDTGMPITVKLSERFYQKLGHELVDEMVNWFNQVDATYRGDLRAINELNFSRFDAKLEQRLARADAKWEQRLGELRAELGALGGELRGELGRLRGEFRAELEAQGKTLMKWMFVFWAGNVASTALLIFGLVHFLRP